MDTLALLCNLHADGPATLQRLRRSGFESIGALKRLDAACLAETLGWTERAAVRFLREAALLRERVDEVEGEPPAEASELEATLLEELDGDEAASEAENELHGELTDTSEETESAEEIAAQVQPPAERVEAVLGAWRELDRVTPPSDPDAFVIPRPPPPADLELDRAGLATLTPALTARLAELGVRTLRQLLERRELELARALPMPYTRLCHLRHQAERALEGVVASAPPVEPRREFRAFSPPPSEPFETAGPFA